MKKAEQRSSIYAPVQATMPQAQPATASTAGRSFNGRRSTDPSSTFRSSRYPVPVTEQRMWRTT